ncbi:MAG: outer membrane beta-barrel protein, partial [Terriglobales bacterium]
GPPGGIMMVRGGPGGRFNINKPHGAVFYSLHDAAFDARPYALSGQPAPKAGYAQQRFGALLGGPFKIPKVYDGSAKNFMFLAFFINRSANPFDAFSTVPTAAERAGDFSSTLVPNGPGAGNPVQIYDPTTHQPFTGNVIPQSRLDPAALALLRFLPLPNQPGTVRNFHYSTTTTSNSQNLNLHFVHNFGAGGPGGMPFPRGGGGSGGKRANINFGLSYNGGDNGRALPFPTLAGQDLNRALNVNFGALYGHGKVTNFFNSSFSRNRIRSSNLYAFKENIAREAGLNGVSQDPFDYGVPSLSFTNFAGTTDVVPLLRRDQTIAFSDSVAVNRGRTNWRFGGDFRFLQLNPDTDSNARGSYVFTGLFTSRLNGRAPVPGTGFDLADYLLGLPQQTSRRFGASRNYFRGKSLSLFMQNDWRIGGSLTLDLGLRYEYASPFREKYNRLVNLDVASGFTQVAPVMPDQTSPYNNPFGPGLLQPDKHAFAPRLGLAWRPFAKTVVRAGYGINFNTGAYANIVSQLASQPPFAQTETLIAGPQTPLTLENGFPVVTANTVLNSYAVDRNYRMGYVQLFNLGIQRDLGHGVIMNLDYNGTKGTRLDMLRSPNRGPNGLRLAGVQPFLYESSEGDSIMHGGSLRLRKRLQHGVSLGGTYTFSKSIDNASSIGGVGNYVAQNDLDLAAERGLSSFDVRHHLNADAIYELPWGSNKPWLAGAGLLPTLFGDWTMSGVLNLASGSPFTARVLGNSGDVARGTNGTLRANATGAPVTLAHPTASAFFNTAAFTTPAAGQFGTAGRNTITGPGTVNFDLALNKNIPLAEGRAWEVRAQAFNLLNHAEFASLDTIVNSPSYGQITAVRAMRRFELSTRFRF